MHLTTFSEFGLWVIFWILVPLPAVLYLLYDLRRQKARADQLLRTLEGLDLAEFYMRTRRKRDYAWWLEKTETEREALFKEIVSRDFRTNLKYKDYLVPVLIVTLLNAVGWSQTLGFTFKIPSLGHTLINVPPAFAWGFVGAYLATLSTLIYKFTSYELGPLTYHGIYQRLLFSTVAAYLLGAIVKDTLTPLISFGIALLPYQTLWDTVSKRASAAIGSAEASGIPEDAALSNIEGLKDPNVRQKLIDLNITTTQALAMQDPLDLFFRTSFPLRMIVDWIDRAILYGYVGKKVDVLRIRGISGAIEMGGLVELSEKMPVESFHNGKIVMEELKKDFKDLDPAKLYAQIEEATGLKHEELLNLIYNLYYDPMVDTLYELWGRN